MGPQREPKARLKTPRFQNGAAHAHGPVGLGIGLPVGMGMRGPTDPWACADPAAPFESRGEAAFPKRRRRCT